MQNNTPGAAAAPTSAALLERLQALHPKKIDLSLDRIRRLLEKLGHPEQKLAPVIHVAGTNGKGSVTQFIRASLEAAGKRVHTYTSPHLVRFHERIRLARNNGVSALIAEPQLMQVLEEVENVNAGDPMTFFEITTAAAFLAFSRTPADAVVLEVGLGGRLDATNLIDKPAVTVITPVSIDHVGFLGPELKGIAAEKAGILKPGVVGVIGPQLPDALAVIEARAKEIGAPLVVHGRDWNVIPSPIEADKFSVKVPALTYERLAVPGLLGPYQLLNAGLAVAAVDQLKGFNVGHGALNEAIRDTKWPARLQKLEGGRMMKNLNNNDELWLDGAHNPGAALALAEQLKLWAVKDKHALVLIVGMLGTKDAENFFRPLAPYTKAVITMPVPGHEATIAPKDLAKMAANVGMKSKAAKTLPEALEYAARETDKAPPGRVLVCGSLYLAGHVLEMDGRNAG